MNPRLDGIESGAESALWRGDFGNATDPTGMAPNQPGATDYVTISKIIRAGGTQVLAQNAGNTNRYFYTKDYGWVDARHFGTAARDVAAGTPGWVEETLGFMNEVRQYASEWGNAYRSGFSPEDLPSNSAGADFGRLLAENPTADPATLFEQWAKSVGATDANSSDFKNEKNKLPMTDPSVRGGQNRGSSNASSTPAGNVRSNDRGSSTGSHSTQTGSCRGSRIGNSKSGSIC